MNKINKVLITELMLKKINKKQFIKKARIKETNINEFLFNMLYCSYIEKNAEEVEVCLYLLFTFNIVDNKFVELMNLLLGCDWHQQHENIAMMLQELKDDSSVPYLYATILKQFDYLEYDEFFALAVKCIWALGTIGTNEAKICLIELQKSENEFIANNAKKQLLRLE